MLIRAGVGGRAEGSRSGNDGRGVARAEGLRPITCNHGSRSRESEVRRLSGPAAFGHASQTPSSPLKFHPRTFLSKPSGRTSDHPATPIITTTGTTRIQQNGTAIYSYASESLKRILGMNGRQAQELGGCDDETCESATWLGEKISTTTNMSRGVGHWTIFPAAGRRPECCHPGLLREGQQPHARAPHPEARSEHLGR